MKFILREGFKNLKLNKLLTLSTFSTMFTSLTLLGMTIAIAFSIMLAFDTFEQKESNIVVFIKSNMSNEYIKQIKSDIGKIDGIKQLEYISNEDALKNMESKVKDSSVYEDIKKDNPLPHTYVVKIKTNYSTDKVYKKINKLNKDIGYTLDIKYEKEYINTVQTTLKNLRIGILGVIALLIIVSLFLIMIVTNLTLYSKSQDLKIMWLMGAPIKFIKGPFLISGATIGLISSVLSSITVYIGYNQYVDLVKKMVPFFADVNLNQNNYFIVGMLIIIGILLGLIGSTYSTNRGIKKLVKTWK